MSVYVDTSALYALLDARDEKHDAASQAWHDLIEHEVALHTCNYVLVESTALVQHRLGVAAVGALQSGLVLPVHVHWIDESYHMTGVAAVLSAQRRDLSLVDCVSFEVI